MKLAIVGPGRSGKDEVAIWMNTYTTLRYRHSTSWVIAPHVAAKLGITTAQAFARRHEDRALWRAEGDRLRRHDPAYLARDTLSGGGQICVGIRSRREMQAVRDERLTDLVIWVERTVPLDDTLEFGAEMTDITIRNVGLLPELFAKLHRFANVTGILRSDLR